MVTKPAGRDVFTAEQIAAAERIRPHWEDLQQQLAEAMTDHLANYEEPTTMTDTTPTEPDTQPDQQLPAWATPTVLDLIRAGLDAWADEMDAFIMRAAPDPSSQLEYLARHLNHAGLVIAPDPQVRIEHYRDTTGDHRWRALDTHNGLVVADSSEGYRTRSHAHHMANRLFPTAHVTEV